MIRLHSMSASISFILSPDEFNVPFYTFIRQCLVNIMWRPLNGYVGCGVWVLCAQKRYHLPEKLTRLEDFSEYFSANSLEARRCLDALVEIATTERYAPNCSKMLYVVKSKVESHTHIVRLRYENGFRIHPTGIKYKTVFLKTVDRYDIYTFCPSSVHCVRTNIKFCLLANASLRCIMILYILCIFMELPGCRIHLQT